jgi:hypothetical protein
MPNERFPWGRVFLSILVLAVLGFVDTMGAAGSTLVAGQIAGAQFDPSDSAYLMTTGTFWFLHGTAGAAALLALLLLVMIWAGFLRGLMGTLAVALALATVLQPAPARAYYEDQDWAENYFILPNESAFWLPDVGDNKSTQTQFGSEQYLRENKVAAKRFTIPHSKLPGSGYFSNKWVPAGRLIIVDRTPFSREWVHGERGTSKNDESFPCQSKEGLDISVGMSIGTSVAEDSAAKFLYHFGVKPPAGDRTKPEVIFQSVYNGKSLAEAMDGPVRNKVQSLVCSEFTSRTFDEDNAQATVILKEVETQVKTYLDGVGITLDYIGWADTFSFDPVVQGAVNRRYVAMRDKEIAEMLGPYASIIEGLALADAIRNKWNGALPSSVSLWSIPQLFTDMLGGMKPAPATK